MRGGEREVRRGERRGGILGIGRRSPTHDPRTDKNQPEVAPA